MNGNGTAAYGMYPRNVTLSEVVSALNRAGYQKENICMVLSPAHPDATIFHDAGTIVAGSEGGSTAHMIRWFSGLGAVVIPTVGVFIRSQAFMKALFTDKASSALSRSCRTLVDLGFSPDDAKRLALQLCDVAALVYVSCEENDTTTSAIELLRRTGAKEAASLEALHAAAAVA
ncbi:MAG TPA: hypothetical protein VMG82_16275 [Candidatus Sulfotelmatobacter sp.]|nr:hypothetical protein [Candidatus Sulfotelmatobacter sp.]